MLKMLMSGKIMTNSELTHKNYYLSSNINNYHRSFYPYLQHSTEYTPYHTTQKGKVNSSFKFKRDSQLVHRVTPSSNLGLYILLHTSLLKC